MRPAAGIQAQDEGLRNGGACDSRKVVAASESSFGGPPGDCIYARLWLMEGTGVPLNHTSHVDEVFYGRELVKCSWIDAAP